MPRCATWRPGERGEVVHRSPQLLLGYWSMPEETAKAFEGGWFHSGDVATIDAEGYLAIVDRTKDLINTGGVLVASREVEEALFTHPEVAEVAVIAVPDPKWIEAVAAVVVLRGAAAGRISRRCCWRMRGSAWRPTSCRSGSSSRRRCRRTPRASC